MRRWFYLSSFFFWYFFFLFILIFIISSLSFFGRSRPPNETIFCNRICWKISFLFTSITSCILINIYNFMFVHHYVCVCVYMCMCAYVYACIDTYLRTYAWHVKYRMRNIYQDPPQMFGPLGATRVSWDLPRNGQFELILRRRAKSGTGLSHIHQWQRLRLILTGRAYSVLLLPLKEKIRFDSIFCCVISGDVTIDWNNCLIMGLIKR